MVERDVQFEAPVDVVRDAVVPPDFGQQLSDEARILLTRSTARR